MKRAAVLACALIMVFGPMTVALRAQAAPGDNKSSVGYSIRDGRAYAYKAGLRDEVIPLIPPCKPEEDPYDCDNSKWEHKENCPEPIEIGRTGKAPQPQPPPEAEPAKGGAGDHAGPPERPDEGTPIQLNRLLSAAKLGHVSGLFEAGGLASSIYTDSSGRSEPLAHTQSEAFASNFAPYEERCYSGDDSGDPRPIDKENYEHFLSRSFKTPSTYHLSECVGKRCQLGLGLSAERARQIVLLEERSGEVSGRLRSTVDGLTSAGGVFTLDSLVTYVTFRSDGTRGGLKWSAVTTASGAKVAGQPVTLPPGETVAGPGFTAGVSEPYVDASKDGTKLNIVALGLHFGSEEQNAFLGGAELVASFGADDAFRFPPFDEPAEEQADPFGTGGGGGLGSFGTGSGGFNIGGPADFDDVAQPPPAASPVAVGEPEDILIYEVVAGYGITAALIAVGLVGWMMLLSRWLQRYAWARRLYRVQPFRALDWMYRAFIKV
ncbi:MAG TPA: hypothetical protein VG929_04605 [Actinomycetota bacterium]|nr:hypothetical protein [Actinomycetota bacterium]